MTHDPTPCPDPLEADLVLLTAPNGTPCTIWASALAADPGAAPRGRGAGLSRLLQSRAVPIAATLCVAALIAGIMLPALGKARSSRPPVASAWVMDESRRTAEYELADHSGISATPKRDSRPVDIQVSADPASPPLPTDQPAAAADRQVIRRATVELQSPDVRATFVKVGLLVSEARGEFVQTSTITGEGPTARAELVLRVASDRLSEVMNHLRSLGEVASENTTGEDVTDQVVDVEARLRNERRVESELLSLLETRKDAPLKEILELRQQIGVVRNEIERMQAQRERLGRLVALATVAVIVRHSEVEPVVTRSEFSQRLERAWAAGLGALTDSLAFLIRAAVGGLLWWALLGVGVTTVLAMRRRDRRRRTDEPAPFLG